MHIKKYVEYSMVYLSERDVNIIEELLNSSNGYYYGIAIDRFPYGYYINIEAYPDYQTEKALENSYFSTQFINIIEQARVDNMSMIKFDKDAEMSDDLIVPQ